MFLGAQSESKGTGHDAPEKCNWHLRNETLTTKNPQDADKKGKRLKFISLHKKVLSDVILDS